jgi:hypothetical protein
MRSGFGYAAGPLSSAETGRCRAGLEVTCTGREVGYSPRTTTSPKPRRLLELSTARRARPPSVRVQLRDLSAEDVDHRLATKAKTLSLAARSRSLPHGLPADRGLGAGPGPAPDRAGLHRSALVSGARPGAVGLRCCTRAKIPAPLDGLAPPVGWSDEAHSAGHRGGRRLGSG